MILVLLAIWLATTIVLYNTTGCESSSVVVVNSSGQDSPMLVIRNYDEVLWKGTLLYPRARAVTVPVHSTGILTVEAMLEDGTFLRSEGGPYVEVMNSGTSLYYDRKNTYRLFAYSRVNEHAISTREYSLFSPRDDGHRTWLPKLPGARRIERGLAVHSQKAVSSTFGCGRTGGGAVSRWTRGCDRSGGFGLKV